MSTDHQVFFKRPNGEPASLWVEASTSSVEAISIAARLKWRLMYSEDITDITINGISAASWFTSPLTASAMDAFCIAHNINPVGLYFNVRSKTIAILNGDDGPRWYDGAHWHDGKVPEYESDRDTVKYNGKRIAGWVRKHRGVWYKDMDSPI